MADWNYEREERENETVTGKQRCVITSAVEKVSKAGNPMIEISVRPSNCRFNVKTWLVKNDNFNRNATQFFDAFPEIGDGNFEFLTWPGAMGAAFFDVDDRGYLKVKYFIDPIRAASLPSFVGEVPERQEVTRLDDDTIAEPTLTEVADDDDGELPF